METKTEFYTFGQTDTDKLKLQAGGEFGPVTVAYETYGTLNADKSNAVLLFHALTGSQHAAGITPEVPGVGERWTPEMQAGWWDDFIGPGKALDTDRFFVVCANYFGGCYGSTGPSSINPDTGKPYGGAFPKFSVSDMVDCQVRLLKDKLGVTQLHAAIGSSMGGMLNANLAVRYPEFCNCFAHAASCFKVSTLTRAHNFEQILAIENDANFKDGDYYDGEPPNRGLALARMISHKTYVSLSAIEQRARNECIQHDEALSWYQVTRPIESYLLHSGQKLLPRFDANTYLHLMATWSDFDLLADTGCEDWQELLGPCKHQRHLLFSIDTDVCFYPGQQLFAHHRLIESQISSELVTVHSDKGHDGFLLEPHLFEHHIRRLID
jgi:homoserine O-acetyltransferase